MRRLVFASSWPVPIVLPSVVLIEPATATLPGENGRLVYVDQVPSQVEGITAGEIYTMDPDGSDVRRLTHDAGRWADRPGATDVVVSSNWGPKWSPDGLLHRVHPPRRVGALLDSPHGRRRDVHPDGHRRIQGDRRTVVVAGRGIPCVRRHASRLGIRGGHLVHHRSRDRPAPPGA